MSDLGKFAAGFQSWCKIIASVSDAEARWSIFNNAAKEVAGYVLGGLDKAVALDELQYMAEAQGLIALKGQDEVQRVFAHVFKDVEPERVPELIELPERTNGKGNGRWQPPPGVIPVRTLAPFPIDEKTIPRRPWLIPGLLLRRHVSVLVAPPGSGKSLLTLQIALMMGTLKPWGGWHPRHQAKVLIINAEDDYDELRRRLVASAVVMKCDQTTLHEWVELADDPQNIIIARSDAKTKTVVRTPMVENIVATITVGGFDCLIVDPFAETFEGNENSNSELKWAALLWREIARRTNCAVLLVHHTKKFANDPGDMDASRGGGALLGVARVVSTVFNMSEHEANAFEIDPEKRYEYMRFDDAKANLSLITFKARWFFKKTYKLDNAGDDEPADEVGVLEPWAPPSVFDRFDEALARVMLDAIDFGLVDDRGAPIGDLYTLTKKGRGGAKRWAGKVVQEHIADTADKDAQKVLDAWYVNKVIFEVERVTSTSKGALRKGLQFNRAHMPGTLIDKVSQ